MICPHCGYDKNGLRDSVCYNCMGDLGKSSPSGPSAGPRQSAHARKTDHLGRAVGLITPSGWQVFLQFALAATFVVGIASLVFGWINVVIICFVAGLFEFILLGLSFAWRMMFADFHLWKHKR